MRSHDGPVFDDLMAMLDGPVFIVTTQADGQPLGCLISFATQTSVRAPGSSLLNPALSFILDSSFGYYGRDNGQFAALGLPIAGDDPSDTRQGFAVQVGHLWRLEAGRVVSITSFGSPALALEHAGITDAELTSARRSQQS